MNECKVNDFENTENKSTVLGKYAKRVTYLIGSLNWYPEI